MKLSIILALGTAAAASTAHADRRTTPETQKAVKAADANLDKLRALKVFEVHRMLVEVPDGTYNCYGPCPGSEKVIEEATRKAAARLQTLTDTALRAAARSTAKACPTRDVEANVKAINDLEIVAIGSPRDQVTPAQACERAAKLANIVTALKAR